MVCMDSTRAEIEQLLGPLLAWIASTFAFAKIEQLLGPCEVKMQALLDRATVAKIIL